MLCREMLRQCCQQRVPPFVTHGQRLHIRPEVETMPDQPYPIPPDDLSRGLTIARPDEDQGLPHIGLVGDTYTILVAGQDTACKYTLIDMHIPPGGGPPPHRHDFEEDVHRP